MVVLNDRVPDGKDISWIWDVDFENLLSDNKIIYISGDRTYDMGIRFNYLFKKTEIKKNEKNIYCVNNHIYTIENIKDAIESFISQSNENDKLYILPTYSAMLEIRKILSGKKLI